MSIFDRIASFRFRKSTAEPTNGDLTSGAEGAQPDDLRRFSREELMLAVATSAAAVKVTPHLRGHELLHKSLAAISRHRREKNRAARKAKAPPETPALLNQR